MGSGILFCMKEALFSLEDEAPLDSPGLGPEEPKPHKGQRIQAAEQGILALKLRRQGFSYRAIGKTLGLSEARASRLCSKALAKLERLQEGEALQLRALELERLDNWLLSLRGRLQAGEPKAIQAALQIQARRLALQGLPLAEMQGGTREEDREREAQALAAGGHGSMAFAELRLGLLSAGGAGASGAEALRAILSQALQAGALRGGPPGGPLPPSPQGGASPSMLAQGAIEAESRAAGPDIPEAP